MEKKEDGKLPSEQLKIIEIKQTQTHIAIERKRKRKREREVGNNTQIYLLNTPFIIININQSIHPIHTSKTSYPSSSHEPDQRSIASITSVQCPMSDEGGKRSTNLLGTGERCIV